MGLYRGYIGVVLGLYGDNGKENGNYYIYIYDGITFFGNLIDIVVSLIPDKEPGSRASGLGCSQTLFRL